MDRDDNKTTDLVVSTKEAQIIRVAELETDPRFVVRFQPITRGKYIAVFALMIFGMIAMMFMFFAMLMRVAALGSRSKHVRKS